MAEKKQLPPIKFEVHDFVMRNNRPMVVIGHAMTRDGWSYFVQAASDGAIGNVHRADWAKEGELVSLDEHKKGLDRQRNLIQNTASESK